MVNLDGNNIAFTKYFSLFYKVIKLLMGCFIIRIVLIEYITLIYVLLK